MAMVRYGVYHTPRDPRKTACRHRCAGFAIAGGRPDDLVGSLGFALLARDRFDIHMLDFTRGEVGWYGHGKEETALFRGNQFWVDKAEAYAPCIPPRPGSRCIFTGL